MPPSAPVTVATAAHLLPFVPVAARPRRAAANDPTLPVADGRRERCARSAAASRVQNAFATDSREVARRLTFIISVQKSPSGTTTLACRSNVRNSGMGKVESSC